MSTDDRIAKLEAENFALAANQCHAGYGDEGGNHRCKEIDALNAEIKALREKLSAVEAENDDWYRLANAQKWK